MKTGACRCGNRIFFNNDKCVSCAAVLGRCDHCTELTSFTQLKAVFRCDKCGTKLLSCSNRTHRVCNSFTGSQESLCRWCSFTTVIPDLSQPKNVQRWAALEAAKRRLLLELECLGFPPFVADVGQTHPLRFQFLEDMVNEVGQPKKTFSGHDEGLITINLEEADSVHRERMRVELDEPQRTLIGHLRHEVGHYIDWSFASRVSAEEYHRLFGDPQAIDYNQAMENHYQNGVPDDWAKNYVSRYATMHPWEDFAESVNAYLDITAIAVTANDQGMRKLDLSAQADAEALIAGVLEIVVAVSEFNADLGLLPLLPERLSPKVIEKLRYVHRLRGLCTDSQGPLAQQLELHGAA